MIGHTHPQYISSESDPTVASHIKDITTIDIYNWNNTASSSHTHSNKSVLDGITDSGVGNWNTAYTAVNNATDVAIGNTIAKRNVSGEIVFSKVTTTALVLNGWTMTIE